VLKQGKLKTKQGNLLAITINICNEETNKTSNEMVIALKKGGRRALTCSHPKFKNLCSKYGFTK